MVGLSASTRVLVVNAGSSSLKLRVLVLAATATGPAAVDRVDRVGRVGPVGGVETDTWEVVDELDLERWDGEHDLDRIEPVVTAAAPVDAVGHRVVHGGTELTAPTRLTADVEAQIEALTTLAPLHQPRALAGLRAVRRLLPADVPHVACFDTAFHATLPAAAATYALPAAWRERWGLRRFGFHGLSHAWAVRRAPVVAGRPDARRIVSCHLGAGASLCAALDGRSVDTTMGFTPLEGLVMATRSGTVDPGLLLWLLDHGGLTSAEVGDGLEHHAGLAGLAGGSGDMRDVLAARARGNADTAAAFDVYIHRLGRELGAMAASLGGVDLVAFTGGVGEHAPEVRAAVVDAMGHLGLALDPDHNAAASGADADLTGPGASASTVVVIAREDLEIAHQVHALLRA